MTGGSHGNPGAGHPPIPSGGIVGALLLAWRRAHRRSAPAPAPAVAPAVAPVPRPAALDPHDPTDVASLAALLDRLEACAVGHERVSVRLVVETFGSRAPGSLLLVPGLLAFSPLSGIPGVSTLTGAMVLLLAAQILLGRSNLWLPGFILDRSLGRVRFLRTIASLRPLARRADRLFQPRMSGFTRGIGLRLIAAVCLLMAVGAPLMEVVPFAISAVGLAVTIFGLATLFRDGLLVLLAFMTCFAIAVLGVVLVV